jgi:hypothetical protein
MFIKYLYTNVYKNMKINESQLRKIIKESIKKVLSEAEAASGHKEWVGPDGKWSDESRPYRLHRIYDNNMPSYLNELSERLERNLNRPYKELIDKIGHNLFSVWSTYKREGEGDPKYEKVHELIFKVTLMDDGLSNVDYKELTKHVHKITHLMFDNFNHPVSNRRGLSYDDTRNEIEYEKHRGIFGFGKQVHIYTEDGFSKTHSSIAIKITDVNSLERNNPSVKVPYSKYQMWSEIPGSFEQYKELNPIWGDKRELHGRKPSLYWKTSESAAESFISAFDRRNPLNSDFRTLTSAINFLANDDFEGVDDDKMAKIIEIDNTLKELGINYRLWS